MAIKTLIKDTMSSFGIMIEKSDSGKLFFGVSRDESYACECYTFDLNSKHSSNLVEVVRDSVLNHDDGTEGFINIEIEVNHDKRIISFSSRTHHGRPFLEINRAYTMIKLYLSHLGSDRNGAKSYPELMGYLREALRHSDDELRKYTVLER